VTTQAASGPRGDDKAAGGGRGRRSRKPRGKAGAADKVEAAGKPVAPKAGNSSKPGSSPKPTVSKADNASKAGSTSKPAASKAGAASKPAGGAKPTDPGTAAGSGKGGNRPPRRRAGRRGERRERGGTNAAKPAPPPAPSTDEQLLATGLAGMQVAADSSRAAAPTRPAGRSLEALDKEMSATVILQRGRKPRVLADTAEVKGGGAKRKAKDVAADTQDVRGAAHAGPGENGVDAGTAEEAGGKGKKKKKKKKDREKKKVEETPEEAAAKHEAAAREALLKKMCKEIRSLCQAVDDHVVDNIHELFEEMWKSDLSPDQQTLQAALLFCAKSGKLSSSEIMFQTMERDETWVDLPVAANILGSVTQKSSPMDGIQFVEDLCHFVKFESQQAKSYYQRHAAMNLSEFLADAQNSFEKVNRGDQNFLVNSGRAELNLAMSRGRKQNEFFFVDADKHTREVPPGAIDFGHGFDNFGFQRSDTALLSLDGPPEHLVNTIPIAEHLKGDPMARPKYVPHVHGCEVEVCASYPRLSCRLVGLPPLGYSEFQHLRWRLDKLGNRNSYQRQLDALKVLVEDDSKGGGNPQKRKTPHHTLRTALLTPMGKNLGDANPSEIALMRGPSEKHLIHMVESEIGDKLNPSQMGALTHAVTRRLTLVQGPPGTGKTHTAIEILTQMVRHRLCPFPILATSDSNIAVDNLLEGLANAGVHVIRVGRPESIRPDLHDYSLDVLMKETGGYGKGGNHAANAEMRSTQVICATAIGSGSDMLDRFRFHTVLVDESTQATETAILVPLAQGCERMILVGDHCQLPPTVLSEEAERRGLAVSLFSRFVSQGVRPVLLDTQYRMHPVIAEFPSDSFYAGHLKTGIEYRARLPPPGFEWPVQGAPVAFVPVNVAEEVKDGTSYVNVAEVDKIAVILMQLVRTGGLPNGVGDIGVITPYSAQVRLIRRTLKDRKFLRDAGLSEIEVSSVDGFQGREKEVIVFSSVRANFDKNVGFLSDWRRMNVMMTRAKRGLIIVGNPSTLHTDRVWHHWLTWAAANGVIQGVITKGQTYEPTYLGNTLMGKSSASDSVLAAGAALYASDMSKLGGGKKAAPPTLEVLERARGGSGAWDSGPDSPLHQPTMRQYESGDEEEDWEDLLDDSQ
jgi:hypothetical protein